MVDKSRDDLMPYGVNTIRLRISFPRPPVSQGYNGRMWRMRPLRGWTGGAEWDAREAAASAAAQGGGPDTGEALRGQAFGGHPAQDVGLAPDAQHPRGDPSGEADWQAALGSHSDAGFRFERFPDPVEQALAVLAAVDAMPGGRYFGLLRQRTPGPMPALLVRQVGTAARLVVRRQWPLRPCRRWT